MKLTDEVARAIDAAVKGTHELEVRPTRQLAAELAIALRDLTEPTPKDETPKLWSAKCTAAKEALVKARAFGVLPAANPSAPATGAWIE